MSLLTVSRHAESSNAAVYAPPSPRVASDTIAARAIRSRREEAVKYANEEVAAVATSVRHAGVVQYHHADKRRHDTTK